MYSVLGVRLTKYQQIHPDIPPAAQQSLQCCLHIDWNPYSTFNIHIPTIFLSIPLPTYYSLIIIQIIIFWNHTW